MHTRYPHSIGHIVYISCYDLLNQNTCIFVSLGLVTSLTVAKDMQKVLCTPSYISIVTCIGVYYITIGGAFNK